MAMIKCYECGKDISDKAAACVNCGAPIVTQQSPSYMPYGESGYTSGPGETDIYQQQPQYNSYQPPQQSYETSPPRKKGKGCLIAALVCAGLLLTVILIVGSCINSSSNDNSVVEPIKHQVIFYNDGEILKEVYVLDGGLLEKPDDPEKEGYIFSHWASHKSSTDGSEVFDFNLPVTSAYGLFAHYTSESVSEAESEETQETYSGVMGALQFNLDIANGIFERPTSMWRDESGQLASLTGELTAYRANAFLLGGSDIQKYRTFYYALHWRDAYIKEFGEDEYIEAAEREISSLISEEEIQKINDMFSNNIEEAEQQAALSRQEFIDSAQTIPYDDLIREPDKYEGEIIKITIKVTQLFEGGGALGFLYEKGYAGTQNGNDWRVEYQLPEGERRIIEGDTVTFYGVFNGVRRETIALTGTSVYIPHLKASYHS